MSISLYSENACLRYALHRQYISLECVKCALGIICGIQWYTDSLSFAYH